MKRIFEWDPREAASNWHKHGIRFETATRVFADPFVIIDADRIEDGELRWTTPGTTDGLQILVVAHTIREADENSEEIEIIRIISARKADRSEKRRYEDESR